MSYELWSQDVFSKGELSPYMYARATVNEYGNGLKRALNVLTYPTGAAGKRFGTLFQYQVTGFQYYNELYFTTFQYLNACVFQFVFTPTSLQIFLEGYPVFILTTPYNANQTYNLSTTVLSGFMRVAAPNIAPMDITLAPSASQTITGFDTDANNNTYLIASGATFNIGQVLPITFTAPLPYTSGFNQIVVGVIYFMNATTATNFYVYTNSYDAKFGLNPIIFAGIGSGGLVTPINNWAINPTVFKNYPFFDFNGPVISYNAITFTPSGANGSITITLSAPYTPLTSDYIYGAFFAGGGSGRITAVADTSHFTVAVENPFVANVAVAGSLVYLAEPAWSDTRGWPQVCSSYQNRGLFANSTSLPNGFWASVINDYNDYGDLTTDDDDAISWYPSSNDINFIRFIVPYRSITVHTNTGIYSSPLSDITAITPTNFTLQLQDSTPADVLLPQAIDNQVLVISGNDAHQMLWDGINNAYSSDIVSVINEQTIREPRDEVAFADLHRAGSRYVFIINANGSMAVFQTLISQNVSGFIPQMMEQSYGNASFIQAASSAEGRVWFIVQRETANAQSPIAISFGTIPTPTAPQTNVTATNSNPFTPLMNPMAITFTTTGSLPNSTPQQITTSLYYWGVWTDANTFTVYYDQDDAINGVNAIQFISAGSDSNVVTWPLEQIFTLEELTQDTYLDCAIQYNGTPTSTVSTGGLFNAQAVKMVGDGFGFDAIGFNNQVAFEAHGSAVEVSEAYIGFPINTIIEPMPLTIANGPSAKNTTLTKPKHIRSVRFMFNNTIGGTINGVPIALEPFNMANIGEPPFPQRGIFEMSVLSGWDDFKNPTYTIFHNDPFNIELLGVFYSVEI